MNLEQRKSEIRSVVLRAADGRRRKRRVLQGSAALAAVLSLCWFFVDQLNSFSADEAALERSVVQENPASEKRSTALKQAAWDSFEFELLSREDAEVDASQDARLERARLEDDELIEWAREADSESGFITVDGQTWAAGEFLGSR